jgi:hypothetical protein
VMDFSALFSILLSGLWSILFFWLNQIYCLLLN